MAISSFTWPTSGIMISGRGSFLAFFTATAALRMARVWIFTKSGIIRPRRQPRRPSIGFCSCIDLIVASSSLSLAVALAPALVTLTSWSSRFGRNSWSGGSIRRMTTGRPDIAARMPSKSPCWSASSLAMAASNCLDGLLLLGGEGLTGGGLGLGASGDVGHEDRAAHDLEARALAEHVLGAAEADALGAVGARLSGLFRLVGVGPDLQACGPCRPIARTVWRSF